MRQMKSVLESNFRGFMRNPRVILTFLLAFILCFFLTERIMVVVERHHVPMQIGEAFIWTFGDASSILLCSLLMILLFIDLPKFSPFSLYMLVRIRKRQWLAAQFLYVLLVTVGYMLSIFLMTTILCAKWVFVGNIWSEASAILGYSEYGTALSVPATVKVMESITPYGCMLQVFLLFTCYSLVLSFLLLYAQMRGGKRAGISVGILFNLYGFLLEPNFLAQILHKDETEMYQVRSLVGWLSPLNHATYGVHDFGYDNLPTIWQSYLIFIGILIILVGFTFHALKKYNFGTFTGEG